MVGDSQDMPITDRATVRYIIRCTLEQSGATRAEDVARRLFLNVRLVREELRYFVDLGLVEVLRPIRAGAISLDDADEDGAESEYYRWIRATDSDYLWQAQLLAQPALNSGPSRHEQEPLPLMKF